MAKVHSSGFKPRIYPWNGSGASMQLDRVQSITPTKTPNKQEVNEIGNDDDLVGHVKGRFELDLSMTQIENAAFAQWLAMANKSDTDEVSVDDFRTAAFDFAAFVRDDSREYIGTVWYPELRVASFSINSSDPDALIERSFTLAGNEAHRWQGANKYVHQVVREVESGDEGDYDIDLSARAPVKDPCLPAGDDSDYFIRILRYRDGVTSELDYSDDYTYNDGTSELTVKDCEVGDVIKVYYTTGVAPTSESELWTPNTVDPVGLSAAYGSAYLYIPASGSPSGDDYLYRVQGLTVEAALTREDLGEFGTDRITDRGVTEKTVTATLNRRNSKASLEEIFCGKGSNYGHINFNEFEDSMTLIVEFYKDIKKTQFGYGIKVQNLGVTGMGGGINVLEYLMNEATLTSKNLTLTSNRSKLGF